MAKINLMDFARLSGVDHAQISRMVKARRLLRVNGVLDTENPVNAVYLMTRFVDVQVAAEMGKPSPGWCLLSVNDAGRKIPIATWTEIDFPKTIRLCRCMYYSITMMTKPQRRKVRAGFSR